MRKFVCLILLHAKTIEQMGLIFCLYLGLDLELQIVAHVLIQI